MPRPKQTLAGRIWVGGVTILIAHIAYTSQIFIIWPWYGREFTIELVQLLLPFKYVRVFQVLAHFDRIFDSLIVAFLYWNYFLCVYTDPGLVPRDWVSNPFNFWKQ